MPAVGDFVSRRLPRNFLDPWDQWLQTAIASSREQLGDSWLDNYLISPIWRFALSSAVCGACPWCGVLMPSVDRVGRYFPLTVALPLRTGQDPISLVVGADRWFGELEDLALAALNEDVDLAGFDKRLMAVQAPLPAAATRFDVPKGATPRVAWELALPSGAQERLACGLSDLLLRRLCTAYSLWWTRDEPGVGSSLLISEGLLAIERYAAMLDGDS